MHRVRVSIRRKLLFATLTPLCVAILLSWFIGASLITDRVFKQAQQKVLGDLNSARKTHQDQINHLTGIVKVAALSPEITDSLMTGRPEKFEGMLHQLLISEKITFLNVIDDSRIVRYRTANPGTKGDHLPDDPLITAALNGELTGGVQIYSTERLSRENPELAKNAAVAIRPTLHSRPGTRQEEQRGMLLIAASPLRDNEGRVIGALQAGFLLNGDNGLVDTITRTVYEQAEGGAATIFLGDVRIATTVRDSTGERATGTLMSEEVARVVLDQGKRWSDRAFVLNDWYLSAYEPIIDSAGAVIGALYVGMPEKPLLRMRSSLNLIFAGVLIFVTLIGIWLSTWISRRLAQPIRALAEGSRRMAAGEQIEPVIVDSDDEIGLLAEEFNTMTKELMALQQTLEQKVSERTTQLEEKNQQLLNAQKELAKAERLAGLGLLAAGVAHEINNPLAIIRGNTELLQDEIPSEAEAREEVEAIMVEISRIERIVGHLRVFSKRENLQPHPFDIRRLLDNILDQIGHQIPLHPYSIKRHYIDSEIVVIGDEERLRQVFSNLVLNGLQAMPEGGKLVLDASFTEDGRSACVSVSDNGSGIKAEHLEQIFTPFFTTKARGTGLGLAVTYGIITDHGGEIRVNSTEGAGTAFTVLLPLAAPEDL
ncbi:MAG: hypothetical protein A2079_05250 [Geobacteraceae bacterium GWC2_48_7]|nr:MAG: hypothetical protein A2079_05250 [Geobacteraceae bacterium GWC2_48_7]